MIKGRRTEVKARHPLYAGLISYNLRGGFLVRPLVIAVCLGLAGAVLSRLEEAYPQFEAWAPGFVYPARGDTAVAQMLLTCIAGAVMTVVSIVFAILLMSLTLASMQFSPRIIVSFTMDRVTQWTLGVFLGTFSYCISVLPVARSYPSAFTPVAAISGAMLLALVCVAWLLFFIHHISRAISVNYIVDRIAGETESIIDEMMPKPANFELPGPAEAATVPEAEQGAHVLSRSSGYIRYVDVVKLTKIAKAHRVTVQVIRRIGQFAPEGVPIATVSRSAKLTPEMAEELAEAFDIGPTRTLQQDIEFGVLQIVDIGLKAISPAVNDPSTGISCVDHLSRILIRFASRQPAEYQFFDPVGVLRVSLPRLDLERMVESAFEQIRMYARGDVAVCLRIMRALGDVAHTVPDPKARRLLAKMGQRVVAGNQGRLEEDELKEMKVRLATLDRLAAESGDPRTPKLESSQKT